MAESVDAIIVDLQVRYAQYEAGFKASTKVVDDHTAALKRLAEAEAGTDGATARASTSRKRASDSEGAAAKKAASEVKAAAKEKAEIIKAAAKAEADAQKAAAKEAAAVVKAAEKEKQAAIAATERAAAQAAARQAQLDASAAARVIHDRTPPPGTGANLGGFSEPGSRTTAARQTDIMSRTSTAATATEREVNNTLIQRIELQERLKVANAEQAAIIRQELTELNLAAGYERAGLEAKEAALRLDRELVVIEQQRADRAAEVVAANQVAIAQLELRARLAATADKAEAVSLSDQFAAVRQIEAYKARGLSQDEATAKVAAETLAIEQRRAAVAAEQSALVERQMRAQQGAIAGKISGAGLTAGALVGGLGAAEVSHLNDEFIKLQNTLRVAGVSTLDFEQVQGRLLATANRSGTDINALADVYRGAALASHDLGASQSDLLRITDAAANALRIQGRSSTEAQGALLQLGHAFESGRVTAREFNSLALNLYPILQAVAKGSDQWGGSVAKLRQEIVTTGVSSKVFFDALLKGSGDLAERASKATLTTAQGFNSLRNALIVYFGQSDKAQGVSAALGQALQALGNNLDVLIPAIAAIGAALVTGYITRMTAAALATRTLGASILGAFGGPIGLAITAVGLAVAGTVVEVNDARLAAAQAKEEYIALKGQLGETGKAAGIAGGGIAGVGTDALGAIPHVNAFAGAVGNLAQQLYEQARAARVARVEQLQGQLQASQRKEVDLSAKLPEGLSGGYRRGDVISNVGIFYDRVKNRLTNTLSGGYQDQDNREAYRQQVQNSLLIQRQIAQAKAAPITASDIPGGGGSNNPNQARMDKLQREIDDLRKIEQGTSGKRRGSIDRQIERRQQQIDALAKGASAGAASAGAYVGGGGPSAETTAKRAEAARKKAVNDEAEYNAALRRAQLGYLEQQAELTNDGAKRADLERQRVRFAEQQYAKEIDADGPVATGGTGKHSAAEVTKLQKLNTDTADAHVQNIDRDERIRIADEARSIDVANLENEKTRLQAQEGLADTTAKRRVIAEQLLDIEYQQKEKALAGILAFDSKASLADRQIALAELQRLPGQKALDKQNLDLRDELPGRAYRRSLKSTSDTVEDAEVGVLKQFNTELDRSVSKALHLHGIFGSIVDDLIDMAVKQALIKPLANSLFGGTGGGAGGGIGGFLSKAFSLVSRNFGGGAGAGASDALDTSVGFASGGQGIISGNPGVDRNLLSLNGNPIAKVGSGELLQISPNVAASNQRVNAPTGGTTVLQTIAVDARGAVMNDEFASQILSKANAHANNVGAKVYGQAVSDAGKNAPAVVRQHQVLKG